MPKCKGKRDKKDCTKLLLKEIEKKTLPPKDSRGVPKEDRKDLEPKWDFQKGRVSLIRKLNNGWMSRRNSGKKKRKGGKEKNKKKVYPESLSLKLV